LIKARGLSIPIPFFGTRLRIFEDPKWLMIIRFIVFGFYPCIEIASGFETSFVFTMFSIFIGVWAVLFMFMAPVLFILEFACWWIVYEDPTLQERFGKESNHIASLALYGSAVAFLIASLFI
jgi:hypothetical protein